MKKLIIAAIFTVASCGTAPVTAGMDKDLCEWSLTAEQSEVETQIRADVQNIMTRENTTAPKAAEVMTELADEGKAINLNYNLYCDESFDNNNIVQWVLGE